LSVRTLSRKRLTTIGKSRANAILAREARGRHTQYDWSICFPEIPMPRWLLGGLLFAAATIPPRTAADDEPVWLSGLPQAKAAAKASGKPVFLVFRCER
jgi:hypothetical protein